MAKAAPLATTLTAILADTYALAVKTHGAHWNVTGAAFFALSLYYVVSTVVRMVKESRD